MDADILSRYAGVAVPRYTSYPTAADFSQTVGPTEYAEWLRHVDARKEISLYLHVPYCRALCHYCGCHAKMATRDEVLIGYRETLKAEIALVSRYLPRNLRLTRLHWGGGTPSILEADGLSDVLTAVRRHFDLDALAEHAIELDPRGVTARLTERLAALGITRASLGVQDLDAIVQAAIGRLQPLETVAAATAALRGAGIEAINFDLVYGLPHQTVQSVSRTAWEVAALAPQRIAAYGYAHLPSRRRNQRLIESAALPAAPARFDQAARLAEIFAAAGYVAVGMDHYARPDDPLAEAMRKGRLRRNFQGYTDDENRVLIGLGASAISLLPDGYVQNIANPSTYRRAIGGGALATCRGHRLTDDDLARGAAIEALMCRGEVDLSAAGPAPVFAKDVTRLHAMMDDGLVSIEGTRISVTAKGRPFVRLAAAVFDCYRREVPGGFSKVV